MPIVIIFSYIVSYLLIWIFAQKKIGNWFNPLSIFLIIFFLHNVSFYFSYTLSSESIQWLAFTNNYSTVNTIALINLSCLWAFYFGFICCYNNKILIKSPIPNVNVNIYFKLYIIFTFMVFVKSIISGGGSYGEDQATTSGEAFNPLWATIISARIIWGIVAIYSSVRNNDNKFKVIILLEIVGIFLIRGRKAFIMIISAYLIMLLSNKRLKMSFTRFCTISSLLLITSYLFVIVIIYRLLPSEMDFIDKITEANTVISNNWDYYFYELLNNANSEGVQNWTLQLIDSGELDYLYGLSYVQAIINTVILRPFQGELVNLQASFVFRDAAYPGMPNVGFDYSFTSEGILNFGLFAFIPYFILGCCISKVFMKSHNNYYYAILYLIIMSILFVTLRTDSVSLFRYLSYYIISIWFFKKINLIKRHENTSN